MRVRDTFEKLWRSTPPQQRDLRPPIFAHYNQMEKDKDKEIVCECGWKVTGISKKHTEANLKIHKKSKLHKKLMENKK